MPIERNDLQELGERMNSMPPSAAVDKLKILGDDEDVDMCLQGVNKISTAKIAYFIIDGEEPDSEDYHSTGGTVTREFLQDIAASLGCSTAGEKVQLARSIADHLEFGWDASKHTAEMSCSGGGGTVTKLFYDQAIKSLL